MCTSSLSLHLILLCLSLMHAVATPIVLSDPSPCSQQNQEKTPLNSLIHQTTSVLELLTQGATRGPRTGCSGGLRSHGGFTCNLLPLTLSSLGKLKHTNTKRGTTTRCFPSASKGLINFLFFPFLLHKALSLSYQLSLM